jgi:hypothetical protein
MIVDNKLFISSKQTVNYRDGTVDQTLIPIPSFNFLTGIKYGDFEFNIKVTLDEIEFIPSYKNDNHRVGAIVNVYQKVLGNENYPITRLFYEYKNDSLTSVVNYNVDSDIIDTKVSLDANVANIRSSVTFGYVPALELTTFDLSTNSTKLLPDRYVSEDDSLTLNITSAYFADDQIVRDYISANGSLSVIPYARPVGRLLGPNLNKSNTIQTNSHFDYCTDTKGLQILFKDILTRVTSLFFDEKTRVEHIKNNYENNSAKKFA